MGCSTFRFVHPCPRLRLGMTPCGRPSLRGGDACLRTVINFGPLYLILILAIGLSGVYFAFAQTRSFVADSAPCIRLVPPTIGHHAVKKKKKLDKIVVIPINVFRDCS